MTSLDISESISVLGDVTLGVHDGLHAAGHGVGEGGEELLLPAENLPGARDLLGEIVQVCGGLHSGNDLLELPPEILNRIEITTLTNPVRDWDLGILEPGGDGAGRVARGAVLHEHLRASHPFLTLEANISGFKAPFGQSWTSFENYMFSAFIWAQAQVNSILASLRKPHFKSYSKESGFL